MNKNIVAAVVALVVSFSAGFFLAKHIGPSNVGGLSERDINAVSLAIGQDGTVRGTKFTFLKTGTCDLVAYASIATSTPGNVDCAAPGVRSGDLVAISLPATSTSASLFIVQSAVASTTTGSIQVQLINLTTASKNPMSINGFGSSTQYRIYRAVN